MSTESLPQPAYAVAPCNDGSRLPAGVVAFEIDSGDGSGDESVSSGVGTMYIVIDLMEGGDLFGNVQATVLLACLRLSSRRCITALY